jgi:hypothetical protein
MEQTGVENFTDFMSSFMEVWQEIDKSWK